MDWKKIAPWNWFKDDAEPTPAQTPAAAQPTSGLQGLLRPSLDIAEGDEHYTVRVELPGIEPDQRRGADESPRPRRRRFEGSRGHGDTGTR